MNKSIIFFGECMIEMRQTADGSLAQSFAGDVYNAAVYLKRTCPNINARLSTCIGQDKMSEAMLSAVNAENIGTDLILKDQVKIPGLYWVHTDAKGERSFTYWRNDSAAKRTVAHFTFTYEEQLAKADMFFFSGISLAIIEPPLREAFWEMVKKIKAAGVKIVFDPNYRPQIWSCVEDTISEYEKAFAYADIALPGIEDMEMLYGINNAEDTVAFFQQFNIEELIIKDGANTIQVLHFEKTYLIPITPVEHVVDTTSAGDSFNGAYLGARLNGQTIEESVRAGAVMAGIVIQHPGAIIPFDAHD
jgi:2-dehydro-3-deoxygluconokinase